MPRFKSEFFNMSLFLFSIFSMKLGQFLILPLLAIYLSHFALSSLSIGMVIASAQLGYSISSLFLGSLSDRFHPQKICVLILSCSGLAYYALYKNQSLIGFICLNTLIALLRAAFDGASKTLLISHVEEQNRNAALGLRYGILNLAAALGPMLGSHYAAANSNHLFHFLACGYLFLSIFSLIFWPKKTNLASLNQSFESKHSIKNTLLILVFSPSLRRLFLINFICYGLYAQITTTLAHHVVNRFHEGISIYSDMLILNAVTCVFMQIFIVPFFKPLPFKLLITLGLFLLSLGFLGFCIAHNKHMLYVSIFLISLGEVIFFPLNDLLLAKIAPPHLLGSYYGALNASTLGLAMGSILGSAIYQLGNYYSLFLLCSLISILTISLYKKIL